MEKHLNVPANTEELAELKSGDYVYLTGTIYTARDAAHKRMYETLLDGKELPVDVKGQFIYYLGPTPAREGQVIGSAGPTTSSRMDKYTPTMLDQGLKGMIGKGKRSSEVIESIKQNGAVYFAAESGVPILPVFITRRPHLFQKVYVVVGDIIEIPTDIKDDKEKIREYSKKMINIIYDLEQEIKKK